MPRMVPPRPDADTPASERVVFDALCDGLPNDWLVLHSRRFVLPGEGGAPSEEGEIDFLVLDPTRGLLALEVKGGEVACKDGHWTSTEGGRVHPIDDPGKQAQRGIHALDRWLRRQTKLSARLPSGMQRIPFGFGVVLPHTVVRGDLGPSLPRKLVVDGRDLAAPSATIGRIFEAHGLAGPRLPAVAVDAFLEVVAPPLRLVRSLSAQLEAERGPTDCANEQEMVEAVRRTLHRLLVEERVPSEHVVVLSTRSPSRSCLARHRTLGSAILVPPEERKKSGQVVFTSLQRFKGLEADFVVLCDVVAGEFTSRPVQLYVGGSRARHGLFVVRRRAQEG